MTASELRIEIHKAIDNVPESALPDLLKYLKTIEYHYPNKKKMYELIDRIIKEDATLLKRLAEYDKNETS